MTLSTLLIWVAAFQASAVSSDISILFTPFEFSFASDDDEVEEETFRYRLFIPEINDPEREYPLILWVNATAHAGTDNLEQLTRLESVFREPADTEKYPFFMLAVQTDPGNASWLHPSPPPLAASGRPRVEPITALMRIVDHTLNNYPIDEDRISAVGISSAGTELWKIGLRYSDRFAAIAPLGSGGSTITDPSRYGQLPIWTFHAIGDVSTPNAGVQRTVSQLRQAGCNVALTEVPPGPATGRHDCWTSAFGDHLLLEWLLAQCRNDPTSPLPGTNTVWWKWHKLWGVHEYSSILISCSILALVIVAIRSERHRRRRSAS